MLLRKKGDLRENVPELIIAVLAILIIAYVGYRLYQIYTGQESENAKKTIDFVVEKINLLKDGQSGKFLIQGFKMKTPLSWFVVGWSKNEEGKPDKCYFDSCICICKVDDPANAFEFELEGLSLKLKETEKARVFKESCQKNGFCRKVDAEKIDVSSVIHLERQIGFVFYTKYLTQQVENPTIEVNFVLIPDNVNEIEIIKEKREGEIYLKIFQTHIIKVDATTYPFGIFGFRIEERK